MKTRHDGDCSIYASLDNNIPEAGVCTCGYGHQLRGQADYSQRYSKELSEKLEKNAGYINLENLTSFKDFQGRMRKYIK